MLHPSRELQGSLSQGSPGSGQALAGRFLNRLTYAGSPATEYFFRKSSHRAAGSIDITPRAAIWPIMPTFPTLRGALIVAGTAPA